MQVFTPTFYSYSMSLFPSKPTLWTIVLRCEQLHTTEIKYIQRRSNTYNKDQIHTTEIKKYPNGH